MVDLTDEIGAWVEPAPTRKSTPGWAWVVIVVLVIGLVAASGYLASAISKPKPHPLTGNVALLTDNVDTLNQEVNELNHLLATVIIGTETFSDSLSAAPPHLQAAIEAVEIKLATIDDTIKTVIPEARAESGDRSANRLQAAQRTLADNRADLSAQLTANLAAVEASLGTTQSELQLQISALQKGLTKSHRSFARQIKVLRMSPKKRAKELAALNRKVKSLSSERLKLVGQVESLQAQVKAQQQQITVLQHPTLTLPSSVPSPSAS